MTATPDVIAAALHEVEQGWAVFALARNSKRPVVEHGFKNATTRPDWAETQLRQTSAGNYGMAWPEDNPERVVVFDLDNGSEGLERPWQERLTELIAVHGPLPKTKATTTPSGGRHAFYRWPTGLPVPPGDELFGFTVRWPGRGYLVGPGSSIDGRPYVAGAETTMAELPEVWVTAALAQRPPRAAQGGLITVTGGFVLPESIPAGLRYSTMRDYIASRYNAGLSADELWELVRTQVAPLYTVPKDEHTLRQDFDRAIAKITERLGTPAAAKRMDPQDAVAAVQPLEMVNLADIAVEAVVWLWFRYLPVGSVTLFDGNPGEGKSTIVADLVARLTVGGQWPDGSDVGPPGLVLYITKEDDAATQVRPRIEAAGGDARNVLFVANDLLFPRDVGRFREALEAIRPRLVLIDPLMSYLEGRVKAISDNEIRAALMTPLGAVAREMGCAILVIRHFNKGSGQSALLRGAGSLGGLAGAARQVLGLTPDPEDEDDRSRVFGVIKLNNEAKPASLKAVIESAPVEGFQMTVSRVRWTGQSSTSVSDLMERSREQHQDDLDAADALRELLEPVGTKVPGKEIASKMKGKGHAKTAVYSARKALHVVIERTGYQGGTLWSLPTGLIHLNHPDGETNGMNGTNDQSDHSSVPPTNETNETNDGTPHSFIHSIHPLVTRASRARVREDDQPDLRVIRDSGPEAAAGWCHFPADHQTKHRDVNADAWCEICTPRVAS